MIFEHKIDPVALEIFNISIYWYSLSYFFGFLLGIQYIKYLIKRTSIDINSNQIDDFFVWSVIGVIVGGRLGYVIFYNLEYFLLNPNEILMVWKGGMSFHGGLIGLSTSMYFFTKKKKIGFFIFANIVSCSVPIGLFLGRIANFINGELSGKPTNGLWGVKFNEDDIPRHPSQLYESFFEGLVLFIILYILVTSQKFKKLNMACVFLIFYGVFRILIELFREPDKHLGLVVFNFSMGQILSFPMIIIGLIFLKKKNEKNTTKFN